MTTKESAAADPARPDRATRRLSPGLAVALLLCAAAVVASVGLVVGVVELPAEPPGPAVQPSEVALTQPSGLVASGDPATTTSPTPAVSASPTVTPPVLRLPGSVPSAGTGYFQYSADQGQVLGSGTQRPLRYRVAVETGSAEDPADFAAVVDQVLADPRSWIGDRRLRLVRVSGQDRHDFTIYLVTARTAQRMCLAGGVDIRIGGKPYTSCRATGKVIINLDRWRRSVDHYVSAEVPLDTYRAYVLNHEVGHELGHRHERCPGAGRMAPVMMQQTLFLRGCTANPWPYPNGRRYAGPPL